MTTLITSTQNVLVVTRIVCAKFDVGMSVENPVREATLNKRWWNENNRKKTLSFSCWTNWKTVNCIPCLSRRKYMGRVLKWRINLLRPPAGWIVQCRRCPPKRICLVLDYAVTIPRTLSPHSNRPLSSFVISAAMFAAMLENNGMNRQWIGMVGHLSQIDYSCNRC